MAINPGDQTTGTSIVICLDGPMDGFITEFDDKANLLKFAKRGLHGYDKVVYCRSETNWHQLVYSHTEPGQDYLA